MNNSGNTIARHKFSTRLQSLRKEKELTQKQLAERLNTSISSIISYENAQRFPSSAVIGLLTQFFRVSREYLMGETDEREDGYAWDDPEIMESVRESLPTQISGLNDTLKDCSAQEQKLTFDILVELSHVLKLQSADQRAASISLLQSVFAASTRYMDVCVNAIQDAEPAARIEGAKRATLDQYTQALDQALIFLPD